MCMEDIRLGRKKYSAVTTISTADNIVTQLVGPNALRTRITLILLSGTGVVGPTPEGVTGVNGFTIGATAFRHEFDIETHGQIVEGAWSFRGNGATVIVFVIETFLAEK